METMCPATYYNIQPTVLFPVSHASPFCFYIFLSLRPHSKEASPYKVKDASIMQIATFQNISGIFDVFKS